MRPYGSKELHHLMPDARGIDINDVSSRGYCFTILVFQVPVEEGSLLVLDEAPDQVAVQGVN